MSVVGGCRKQAVGSEPCSAPMQAACRRRCRLQWVPSNTADRIESSGSSAGRQEAAPASQQHRCLQRPRRRPPSPLPHQASLHMRRSSSSAAMGLLQALVHLSFNAPARRMSSSESDDVPIIAAKPASHAADAAAAASAEPAPRLTRRASGRISGAQSREGTAEPEGSAAAVDRQQSGRRASGRQRGAAAAQPHPPQHGGGGRAGKRPSSPPPPTTDTIPPPTTDTIPYDPEHLIRCGAPAHCCCWPDRSAACGGCVALAEGCPPTARLPAPPPPAAPVPHASCH